VIARKIHILKKADKLRTEMMNPNSQKISSMFLPKGLNTTSVSNIKNGNQFKSKLNEKETEKIEINGTSSHFDKIIHLDSGSEEEKEEEYEKQKKK